MATNNVPALAGAETASTSEPESHPPLDTVLLWLTPTIERDFEHRGAFPNLRLAKAKATRGSGALHYLTPDEAEAVLMDVAAREQSASRGVKIAYGSLKSSLLTAMEEAAERPEKFASPTARCVHKSSFSERWCGTKDQLQAHGIQLAGPWPHEPGGKERWAHARDSRGYKASITRDSSLWPGLYGVQIKIPNKVALAAYDAEVAADKAARPAAASFAEFRAKRQRTLDDMINVLWKLVFTDKDGAYAFEIGEETDAYADIGSAFGLLRHAADSATIARNNEFAAKQERAQHVRAARADSVFQDFLSRTVAK